MSNYKNPKCFICLESTLQHVNVKAPLASGAIIAENDENEMKNFTYLECLRYCSKLEFNLEENEIQTLCYKCARNLEKFYQFLQQVSDAHERLLIIEEFKFDEIAEQSKDMLDTETIKTEIEDDVENAAEATVLSSCKDNTALEESITEWYTDLFVEICNDENEATEQTENNEAAELNTKTTLACSICNKKFLYLKTFQHHWKQMHNMAPQNYCSICCNFLDKNTTMPEHIHNMHSQTASWEEQNPQQAVRAQPNQHKQNERIMLRNTDVKCRYFFCSECSKLFHTKALLQKHLRSHESLIACKKCSQKFASFAELKVHMLFHTGAYPETCEICGEKFAIKSHLRTHRMRQHESWQFKCSKCDKLFTSSTLLSAHELTHAALTCHVCEKMFTSKIKLTTHLKRKHNVKSTAKESQTSSNYLESRHSSKKIIPKKHVDEIQVKDHDDDDDTIDNLLYNDLFALS